MKLKPRGIPWSYPRNVREVLQFGYCVAVAVSGLHAKRIIHGDLHSGNVVAVGDDAWYVIDLDYGVVVAEDDDLNAVPTGSLCGLKASNHAPESIKRKSTYGPAVDVWGLGFVLKCRARVLTEAERSVQVEFCGGELEKDVNADTDRASSGSGSPTAASSTTTPTRPATAAEEVVTAAAADTGPPARAGGTNATTSTDVPTGATTVTATTYTSMSSATPPTPTTTTSATSPTPVIPLTSADVSWAWSLEQFYTRCMNDDPSQRPSVPTCVSFLTAACETFGVALPVPVLLE